MFSCKYCGIFKITCFEEHLRTAASIRCSFDTINLKQCGFCTTYFLKILFVERKYKNNLKTRESQKKKKRKITVSYIHIYNINNVLIDRIELEYLFYCSNLFVNGCFWISNCLKYHMGQSIQE